MTPQDFVYTQIYKGALKGKASERMAQQHAQIGLDIYKKNKFSGKASELIKLYINMAIKSTKKKN